ncbi:hypothetical protein, partial [Klebsiella pneumoniae]|uniref:hypothetical protein n=1 Tax=Klebsiella pneumoniae TaxID=573 RepID=UPI00301354DA
CQAGMHLIEAVTQPVEPPTPDDMLKLLKLAEEFGIKIIAPPEPPAGQTPRCGVSTSQVGSGINQLVEWS